MTEQVRVRLKDYYADPVGDEEYLYVSKEVYEILADIFRKEAHAQEMRDYRHIIRKEFSEDEMYGYTAGEQEALEDMVIRKMELEQLKEALQMLTPIQRERIQMYFFEGMTTREIALKTGNAQTVIWKSLEKSIKKLKKFMEVGCQNAF